MIYERSIEDKITETIIGCGIEVHKILGPGLLESAYEECLCYELSQKNLSFQRQADLPVIYKGVRLRVCLNFQAVSCLSIIRIIANWITAFETSVFSS